MGAEVFVSYSNQDRDRVIPVVEYLRNSGISVWVDEGNIHAADLWSEQIVQAIAGCRVMVVMLSGNSTDSHNVVKEAMLASEQKKALLPVYLEPAEIPAKLQYQLAGIQHLELYGQDEQQVLADLTSGLIKRGVSGEGDVASPQPSTVKRHEPPRPMPTTPSQPKNIVKPIAWALAVCVVALLGLIFLKLPVNEPIQKIDTHQKSKIGRIHLTLSIPEEYPMVKPTEMPFGVMRRSLAISDDGEYLVYVCMFENERHLCLRRLSDDSFRLLSESNGALLPFFSPDGKWVGFVTEKKVKKIEISSGLVKIICNAKNPYTGATWCSDGSIYFGDSEGVNFYKVTENGGEPSLLTAKIFRVFGPSAAPNGLGVLFRASGVSVSRGPYSVYFIELNNGNITRLSDGITPSLFNEKYLVTTEDGQLRFTEIDFESLKPVGAPRTIIKSKIIYHRYGAQYSLSENNILVFIKGVSRPELQLTVLDHKKNESKPLIKRKEVFGQYSVSPNGEKIAVEVVNNQISDINILDIKRSRLSSFAKSEHNYTPFWSSDGNKLYYTSNRTDPTLFELYVYDFESRNEEKIELGGDSMGTFNISDISGDGERLLCFGAKGGGGLNELYLVDIKEQKRTQLTDNKLTEWGGVFSLDEKWVAYTSEKDMEGSYAIYLNRFPEMDKEIRISNGGGEEPKWLPDGSAVYYRNGSKWMKVTLKLDGELQIGEPELFFEGDYVNVWGPSHDIFPDGRILLLKGEEWVPPTEIDVIINALDLAP